tara:strand:+ start:5318 stop:5584 length:267 start_codon:yes stop_codon:yes gene_type:complete
MAKIKKLTPNVLKRLVLEEKAKIEKEKSNVDVDTVEDAWSGGKKNLVNKIDYVKKLGIKEAKLRRRANRMVSASKLLKYQISKDLKDL